MMEFWYPKLQRAVGYYVGGGCFDISYPTSKTRRADVKLVEIFRLRLLAKQIFILQKGNTMKIGDTIKINSMKGEPNYTGRVGIITSIDDIGQLHGTWGGLAVVPNEDEIEVIDKCD